MRWPLAVRRLDLSGFDVFHAHGDDHLRLGRPTPAHVRTMHGSCLSEALHIHGARERLRMVLLGLTEVVATVVADQTVLVSRDHATLVPLGAPRHPQRRRHRAGSTPGPATSDPTIVFVGTYGQRKRGRLLMEVFEREVRPAVPDAQLWMVCSDAPDRPGVEVLGRLTDDELAERYRRAWVFCLPSTYEGFGVPYIEAMASGTAVVATPNPGAREVLGDGRYGRLSDEDGLGTALVDLLRDDGRRQTLAEAGLARSATYDWDRVAEAYERLYEELLSRR